jgi:hypothetical protein
LKLGIVSDLHCNIDGLDRALETMGPIDALLCLGDSIYEYSFSNAVTGRTNMAKDGKPAPAARLPHPYEVMEYPGGMLGDVGIFVSWT